ncbi:unnamed protein product [Durusdinium trenchii]|uniref:Phytanoyl-CoA dioxygenase n=1 Tax=Durusdinium trenchii TaxID=1381693 RepID=A0ABP0NYR1_9DINO
MAEAEVVERFPATVQVVGAPEPVINQHYKRVTLAQLRQHKKVKQQMANGLDVAYMVEVAPPAQGERPDQKRRWPYIWFQHDQIKIAMMGDNSSRYFANLHPFGFGPTQQWVDAENQFLTELRVLPAKGSDTDSSEACELELEPEKEANCPQLEEVHRAELREQGFTVVGPTAAFRCAVLDALRLANMLLGAAVNWSLGNFSAPWADKLLASNSEGAGLRNPFASPGRPFRCHNLRVRLNDEASAPFAKVLSFILPLAEELMQEPVEVPNCCQLASLPPDGAPTSDWTSQGDQTTTYHVDGRGQLKNNIALIVGVALTPPERSSSSWGAFVCHPGSHRNARLHQQYTDQYEGRVEPMDLGSPHMVPLGQADLLVAHPLLAHRRSQNWSCSWRHWVYYRLRPRSAQQNPSWQDGVLEDPLGILPGLATGRDGAGKPSELGSSRKKRRRKQAAARSGRERQEFGRRRKALGWMFDVHSASWFQECLLYCAMVNCLALHATCGCEI